VAPKAIVISGPITGTLRWPRFTMACNVGKIFLWARSPVAPKKTKASECWSAISNSFGLAIAQSTRPYYRRKNGLLGGLEETSPGIPKVQRILGFSGAEAIGPQNHPEGRRSF